MSHNIRPYFIIVFLLHLALMLIPVSVETVMELNVVEPTVIQVKLLSPEDESESEAFKFVETEHNGIKEEVDTKLLSDVTQQVEEQTVTVKPSGAKSGDVKERVVTTSPSFSDLAAPTSDEGILPQAKSQGQEMNLGSDVDSLPVFMEDVAESDKTSLSTIEYEYSSFYKRINGQVYNSWTPLLMQLDPNHFSRRSFQTRIILKINPQGEIIAAKIDGSSGEEILDNIAQQTFAKVRIFPNPPKELFNGKQYLYLTWILDLRNN